MAGIAITVVTFILGIAITIFRKVDEDLIEAKSSIEKEFLQAYTEFGHTVMADATNFERLQMCVTRLRNLHCASVVDLPTIVKITRFTGAALYVAILVFLMQVTSLVVGYCLRSGSYRTAQFILLLVLPFALLLLQSIVLCVVIGCERYLKRAKHRYRNMEYQS